VIGYDAQIIGIPELLSFFVDWIKNSAIYFERKKPKKCKLSVAQVLFNQN